MGSMSSPALSAVVVCLAAAACADRDSASRAALTVIDSAYATSWDATEDSAFVYELEVASRTRSDTIRDVITPLPIMAGDTLVTGLLQVSEDSSTPERKVFRLRLRDGAMEIRALPPDVWAYFHDLVFSPDGRYLAYVAEDPIAGETGTFAIVRDLINNRVVARGPSGGGCDCEVDANYARWIPPDSFEIAVSHAANSSGWQLVSGRSSTGRVHVDTLQREPSWE